MKTSKSAGHDRIPPKLLKDAAEEIAPSLAAIFNASIIILCFTRINYKISDKVKVKQFNKNRYS
jgi:hypothetical protein